MFDRSELISTHGRGGNAHRSRFAFAASLSLLAHLVIAALLAASPFVITAPPAPPAAAREFALAVDVRPAPCDSLQPAAVPVPPEPAVAAQSLVAPLPTAGAGPPPTLHLAPLEPEIAPATPLAPGRVPAPHYIVRIRPVVADTVAGNVASSASQTVVAGTPVKPPQCLRKTAPDYPHLARKMGWEGLVVIRVRVGADGSCLGASVMQSSGYAVLDEAAREAVQAWQFTPATKGEVPVEGELDIPIRFTLVD